MSNLDNIYVSLDEARAELARRREDSLLQKEVENEIGDLFWPMMKEEPHSVMWKYVLSPDNGFAFFLHLAAYVNARPLAVEYLGDTFLTLNEEKKGLGRLRVTLPDKSRGLVDIMDFPPNQKRLMEEVTLKNGTHLVDFHHDLMRRSGFESRVWDSTSWAHAIGKPSDYYYAYLAHFIAHGVAFEAYLTDDPDEREVAFTRDVVAPTMDKLEERFGYRPLIVRLFPEQQSDEEDFHWWSYPPHVNDYIVEYIQAQGFPIRSWQPET